MPHAMQRAAGMALLLLALFQGGEALLRTQQAANASRPLPSACSCDCCLASTSGCAPRGDCRLCAPGALQESFAALENEVDYSRFCHAACQPLSSEQGEPCSERSQEASLVGLAASPAAAPASAPASAPSAAQQGQGEAAAASLAEVALLRAQRHAREAKQSAALARYAYEKLAKSRQMAAEAAGQAALEDVILDARKDAKEATEIRAGWEDQMRAQASQKAVVAAAVYKKAKLRNLAVAEAWDKHATDLTKTSRQYEEYAMRQEIQEKKLKATVAQGSSSPSALKRLHDAEVNVNEGLRAVRRYEEDAQAARREAAGIRANASWYDEAEAAAAAHALYAALPEGVVPPPLPALP
ncbi:unnamed protein product [Effrenium voratum]|uniref:Uncharacterized protein n=1 Tax=Effrenium voratum TaxID=2562239 RepID=A0AA36IUJ2_9DINO|nr:unnamed protein product [Effrenium voratum]CAJ1447054.1 unnamed protein product [Effrenium voratum]